MAAYTRHVTAMSWAVTIFFMAAACATRLPHRRPGKAVAFGPRLLIRHGKPCLFRS